ncbi:hypothetical protein, partial [Vibrio alfacsensis]
LEPSALWLQKDEFYSQLKAYPQLLCSVDSVDEKAGRVNAPVEALPDLAVQHQLKEPMAQIRQFTEQYAGKVIFSVESEGRREALLELLHRIKLRPQEKEHFLDALK